MIKRFFQKEKPYFIGYYNQWFEPDDPNRYVIKYCWYRTIQTHNEIRQNHHAIMDGYNVRGKRKNLPDNYDDPNISRWCGKSWKDFTKARKQYMKNFG